MCPNDKWEMWLSGTFSLWRVCSWSWLLHSVTSWIRVLLEQRKTKQIRAVGWTGEGSSEAAQLHYGLHAPLPVELIPGPFHRAWACSHLFHLGPSNRPRVSRHHHEPLIWLGLCPEEPISGSVLSPALLLTGQVTLKEPLFSHVWDGVEDACLGGQMWS